MKGQVSEDFEVGVDADALWDVYGSLKLGILANELLPNIIEKVEILEGDGGVGTVLGLTFPSETPGSNYYKEKFTKIDNEKRLKEAETVEGGFLLLGFSLYRICLEIIEKKDDKSSSIIRSTIEYEIEDEHAVNASLVNTKSLQMMAEAIGNYLLQKKANPNKA